MVKAIIVAPTTVQINQQVTLDGSQSTDYTKIHWIRKKGEKVKIQNEWGPIATFTPKKAGKIIIKLKCDGDGTSRAFITIVVTAGPPPNQPPIVSAGNDLTVKENILVVIDGSANDLDGTIRTIDWFQNSGPMVSITQDEIDRSNFSFTTPPVPTGQTNYQLEFMIRAIDDQGARAEDIVRVTVSKDGTQPPPDPVTLIYDSNRDGHWNNGVKRTITDFEGDISPCGKGLETAASGDPKFEVQGDGEAWLVCKEGHGRGYTKACNFNSSLEMDFNIDSSSVDNLSLKLRSRHQEGGACSNRFGGFGTAISLNDVDLKTESCHNNHENSITRSLSRKLALKTWYKVKYECKNTPDNQDVQFTTWIDYNDGNGWFKVIDGKHTSPQNYYVDKVSFDTSSYFWIRLNGAGTIKLRNVKLLAL